MTTIRFPWPPTTNNHMMSVRGRLIPTSKTQYWRKLAAISTQGYPPLGSGPFVVTMTFHCATRRAYDISNFVKEIEDALTRAGVWEDDSRVDELHLYRGAVSPTTGFVVVDIRKVEP